MIGDCCTDVDWQHNSQSAGSLRAAHAGSCAAVKLESIPPVSCWKSQEEIEWIRSMLLATRRCNLTLARPVKLS
jgi:hypothetical protein